MPLVVCYEIHLQRDRNRPIFLTRVRDASNALNIASYQVKILNESWLHKVEWTANVIETLCDEDKLEADDPVHVLKQGDIINDQQVQRPLAFVPPASGCFAGYTAGPTGDVTDLSGYSLAITEREPAE